MYNEETGRNGRRKFKELDDIAIAAAQVVYGEGLKGETAVRRLQEMGYTIRNNRDLRLFLKRARDCSLVEILVAKVEDPPINIDLGNELEGLLGIPEVVVVKCCDATSSAADGCQMVSDTEGELLSRKLAMQVPRIFTRRVRAGDQVGVAGGHTLANFVEELGKHLIGSNLEDFRGIRISSLAGGVIYTSAGIPTLNLDADFVATTLGHILKVEDVDRVYLPISINGKCDEWREGVINAVAPHILGDVPTVVVLGMGIVTPSHHLIRQHSIHTAAIQPYLDVIKEEILPVAPLCIAEICGQPFWCGDGDSDIIRHRAQEVIKELNKRMVSMALEKLNDAKIKIMIAGGKTKYPGLRTLLIDGALGLRLTVLVTDEDTAICLKRDRLGSGRRT